MEKKRYEIPDYPRGETESDNEYLRRVHGSPPKTVIRWGPITYRLEEFPPDRCRSFQAEHNDGNRPKSPTTIERYAAVTAAGDWAHNGDAIVRLAADKKQKNGQHVLEAHARADRLLVALVVRGLDPDTAMTMDIPFRRSLMHSLVMRDFDHPRDASPAVQWTWRINEGRVAIAMKGRPPEYKHQLVLADRWRDMLEEGVEYTTRGEVGAPLTSILGVGPTAALYTHVGFTHRLAIREFYRVLALGDGYRRPFQSCPAWTLTQQLRRQPWRMQTKPGLLLSIVRAWNAWAQNRPLTRIDGLDHDDYRTFPVITGCAACAHWVD